MSDIFDHDMVETRTGNFPVLQDDERSIPFHWVDDMKALIAGGHWTPEALEAVIGEPRDYASRIVRLFVVLPKLTVDDVNIPDMARMLDAYAKA
ncbi:MAG TPA: hypothetical protein VFM05_13800, partial [Candidatus Saccharimonadales bacterium]|nr:hypothetical protein [Candidatus Saccharimonadales bacterium]